MALLRASPQLESLAWTTLAVIIAAWSFVLLSMEKSYVKLLRPPNLVINERDIPAMYPLTVDTVFIEPEDTSCYQIYSNDGLNDWNSMFPPNGGWVHLESQNRTFQLTVFHELWCLGVIRGAVAAQSIAENTVHLQNCFNYLRELILCRADLTLEDVLNAEHSVNHIFPHTCKDWDSVFNAIVDKNEQSF